MTRRHGRGRPHFPPDDLLPPAGCLASETNKGHGRLEKRTLRTTSSLTKHQDWAGLKQGFELTRERTIKGVQTVETVRGITSLSAERADASRLLELTRKHWGIENGLHYRRDVTMGEDASRVRKGTAPQVMAALRNTIIHALDELGDNLAAAMRTLNNCLSQALSFIGLPQHE
jgi:predicted transposase YbfD/YdcC